MAKLQKIVPFLWFNRDAEEAVAFYTRTFGGKEVSRLLYGGAGPGPKGSVCTIDFEILGTKVVAINGLQDGQYTDAISLMVMTEDQAELDRYWDALVAGGGKPVACGWIQDRWGLRWQIVPAEWMAVLASGDSAAIERGFKLMMTMVKLDGPALMEASRNEAA